MIEDDLIKVTDSGANYTFGELKTRHQDFAYLDGGALVARFDGLDTMLNYVKKNMPKAQRGEASTKNEGAGDGFNAFNSYKEAMDTFTSSPDKVVRFNPAELRIKDDSEAGNTVDYDVVGDYIDMGRYMEGIPEAWGSMHNGNARNRRVNILIDLNQVWSIKHGDITHRGERILRLVDALEAGGIRTQLVGMESNECGHVEIILKRHGEPLTITDLAVVSHPEFLRRIIFRVNEYSKSWDWGYGSPYRFGNTITAKPELIDSDINDEMNILIGSNMAGIDYIDSQFDKLEKLLTWEMSKPVPEVDAVKVDDNGIFFNPNGARDVDEVRREGLEAINAE